MPEWVKAGRLNCLWRELFYGGSTSVPAFDNLPPKAWNALGSQISPNYFAEITTVSLGLWRCADFVASVMRLKFVGDIHRGIRGSSGVFVRTNGFGSSFD
ncbi:hypothetical protein [Nonomuraea recticatena]|uniref:hypothetical protein n=1 Tax=Nonomuraea recticatena TaxID=46178 RepID=UPI0031F9949B